MQKKNIILLIISSLVLTPLQAQAGYDLIKALGVAGTTLFTLCALTSINSEEKPLDKEIETQNQKIEKQTIALEKSKKIHNRLLELKEKFTNLTNKRESNKTHTELIKSNISKLEKNKQNNINTIFRYGSTLGAIAGGVALYILMYKYINQTVSPEDHHLRIMKVRAEIASLEKAYNMAKGTAKEYSVNAELSKKKALLQSLENQQISPNKGTLSLRAIIGFVAAIAASGITTWKLAHILLPHYTPTKKETQRIKNYKMALENIQNHNEKITENIESKDIEIKLLEKEYSHCDSKKIQTKLAMLIQEKSNLESQQAHILGEDQSSNNPLSGLLDMIRSIGLLA